MSENSYVSSMHDWNTDQIMVWERPVGGGERCVQMYDAPRYFYVPDEDGKFTTITDQKVTKLSFDNKDEFEREKKRHRLTFESDFQPEARLLMDEYYGRPTPVINYAFLDIEVDYDPKLGWSSPENPYAPINAITIYQSWTGKYLTYAVPPKKWSGTIDDLMVSIKALCVEHHLEFEPDVTICKNERDLLLYMLGDIENADIISGWNSEFFDNPYIIKRIETVLGSKAVSGMCFKGARPPNERVVNRFGSPAITYTLSGRTHLDYLDLFKKFTFEGRVSYSLANISAEELDTPKLDYPGTLAELYNNDFAHFVTYNAHDVGVLVQLDRKFNLMQLVNQMAHENTVPFMAILGTVRYVETGITNRAHNVHNLIVTDKVNIEAGGNAKVEGAIVMTPLAGLHQFIGSVDLTSLYPSVDRALNMSIETFIGQFDEEEKAWDSIRAKDDNRWALNGEMKSGAEWNAWLRENNYAISAFGTVFDQNKPGMLSDTLTYWFEERIRLQGDKKKYAKLADAETDPVKKLEYEKLAEHYDLLQLTKKIQLNSAYGAALNENFRWGRREIGASITGTGRQITKHMTESIAHIITGRPVSLMKRFAPGTHDKDGNRIREKAPAFLSFNTANAEELAALNKKSFSMGKGRKITEPYARAVLTGDMTSLMYGLPTEVELIFKKHQETGEMRLVPTGAVYWSMFTDDNTVCNAIIYGDTDSCYFMTYGTNYDEAVATADEIAKITNSSFPSFMQEAFNCTGGRETFLKAAREIVAERGLFMFAKKKYTLNVVNLDGKDLRKKPKLKSMGSEIKKADTPKVVQEFLKELMGLVLDGEPYAKLEALVNSKRGSLIGPDTDVLSLAPAKQVNNLDTYYAEFKRTEKVGDGKCKLPGHVRASINYNELILMYDPEGGLKPLKAGDKAAILYLKPNHLGIKSIGFPADMQHIPAWFKQEFQVDLVLTEEKMIDSKIDGIFEALGEEMPTPQNSFLNSTFQF